jgi:hypothetical protein
MKLSHILGFVLFLFSFSFPFLSASDLRLNVNGIPANGLVIQTVDLNPAASWLQIDPQTICGVEIRYGDITVPNQTIIKNGIAQLIVQFPDEPVQRSQTETLICHLRLLTGDISATEIQPTDEIVTETPVCRIRQSAKIQAGMPSRIEFVKTNRILETHRWFDRLYHPNRPGFNVTGAVDCQLTLLADGSLCRVVRNKILLQGDNLPPEKRPQIVYTWFYSKQHPCLVFVTADYSQPELLEWKECHFLELHVADGSFAEYLDLKNPAEKTKFDGSKKSLITNGAAIIDNENRIALFGLDDVTIYDGLREFGQYLMGNGQNA